MIVFINGPFGAGKSTVAEELVKRIPNSLLYNAEEPGYMLRKIVTPIDKLDDFQDLPAWRELVVKTAELLKKQYGRNLIIPMCIWNTKYFDEVIPGLRAIDSQFYHFCLIASKETLKNRLTQREGSNDGNAWGIVRIEECLSAFESEKFEKKITTEGKHINDVVEEILSNIQ